MRLRDCVLVEVRNATTRGTVAAGCLKKEPGKVEEALGLAERWFREKEPRSGAAIIIRCPGR